MALKAGVIALVAGLAAFFGVGIGVTAITEHWVDYELLPGLMAGAIAGLAATIVASTAATDDLPDGRYRVAATVGGFAVGFVGGVLVAAGLGIAGAVGSVGVGFAAGVLVAVGAYKFGPAPAESADARGASGPDE